MRVCVAGPPSVTLWFTFAPEYACVPTPRVAMCAPAYACVPKPCLTCLRMQGLLQRFEPKPSLLNFGNLFGGGKK